jgi:hypothetical protein
MKHKIALSFLCLVLCAGILPAQWQSGDYYDTGWLQRGIRGFSLSGYLRADGIDPLTADWTTKYPILFPNGTLAAPSISFENQSASGLYYTTSHSQIGVAGIGLGFNNANMIFSYSGGTYIWNSFNVVNSNASAYYLTLSSTQALFGVPIYSQTKWITAGTGTGLTVNDAGSLTRQTYKVTVTYAGFSAAALTADHTIATLPAKTKIVGFYADTTVPFTGGGVTATALTVGKSAGGTEYIASHDVLSGAVTKGLADADMGTELVAAALIQGGAVVNWSGTTTVSARITTTTANTNALTAGSVTFYIITERY